MKMWISCDAIGCCNNADVDLEALARELGPDYRIAALRRVFVFLGLGCSESAPNHRALRESLLIADSRQRGRDTICPPCLARVER
jgi:hypothetical protein